MSEEMRRACFDDVIAYADLETLAGSAGAVKAVTKSFTYSQMTGSTTTAYIDMDKVTAPAFVLGWTCVVTTGFTGGSNTTATIKVGTSTTADLFSATTSGSVASAGTVGSLCKTTYVYLALSDVTPRITITVDNAWSGISAGAATVTLYYIEV